MYLLMAGHDEGWQAAVRDPRPSAARTSHTGFGHPSLCAATYPAVDLHVVVDNYATRSSPADERERPRPTRVRDSRH